MPDIESLERATLAAVPPQELLALDGWLVALDDGTVGRAHSAVPTRHDAVRADVLPDMLDRYAARGLRAAFRVPKAASFDGVRAFLSSRGGRASQPTLTMAGALDGLARLSAADDVELADTAGEDWAQVFLGEGFDPVDGASRLAILRRARHSVFASVRREGQVVAVGSACFAEGWCGLHGLRTAPAWRGRGVGSAMLAALARHARRRGLSRAFLQVEEANTGAQRLYRRAGLRTAWCYEYWRLA